MGRKKLDRVQTSLRVNSATPGVLKSIAFSLGLVHNGEGSIGQLLDAIADGNYLLVPSTKPKNKRNTNIE